MKGAAAISKLILVVSYVTLIAHTMAETPEAVKNQFIAHRLRQREARFLERTVPSKFQSAPLRPQGPLHPYDASFEANSNSSTSTITLLSDNWSGALQLNPPSGVFNAVSGRWTLPTISPPPSQKGVAGEWYSSEWVGIDGATCQRAIIQAGTLSFVQVNSSGGVTSGSSAWYEWFPQPLILFDNITVNEGDVVEVFITVQSEFKGKVVLVNLSQKTSTSIDIEAPTNSSGLCGRNAEWILEDFSSNGGLVPFSSFTNVTFSECAAGTTTGAKVNLKNSSLIEISQNKTILAVPSFISYSDLLISYNYTN